jgi:hypothetical protein
MTYRTDDTSQIPRTALTSSQAAYRSPAPPRRTGRARRWVLGTGAVLVAMAAGAAIGIALTRDSGTAAPAATTVPTSAPASHTGSATAGTSHGARGQITAESGSSWTVVTAKQKTITVIVSPTTKFGTAAAPATAAQFPVGTTVAVRGHRSGATITALRMFVPSAAGAGTTTPTAAG